MDEEKIPKKYNALRFAGERTGNDSIELIGEEPLLVRIQGKPYAVVMRTPGDEMFHAAGFCLAEGIVDAVDDFLTLGHCKELDPNVVEIRLQPQRVEEIGAILKRRSFVSQTSCGICGKEMVQDLYQKLEPAEDGFSIRAGQIFGCIRTLFAKQSYYPRTKGAHAALLLDGNLKPVSFAEDVGRHNALDKAVGKALMEGKLSRAELLVMSSRISFELVQKAARARIPVIVSKSRPTALAVDIGQRLNMTIASAFHESELIVFCGPDRVVKN